MEHQIICMHLCIVRFGPSFPGVALFTFNSMKNVTKSCRPTRYRPYTDGTELTGASCIGLLSRVTYYIQEVQLLLGDRATRKHANCQGLLKWTWKCKATIIILYYVALVVLH